MTLRTTWAVGVGVASFLALAGCTKDGGPYDPYAGGGSAAGRCRPDPGDPKQPGKSAVQDREWEDPNDDGRPPCRAVPSLPEASARPPVASDAGAPRPDVGGDRGVDGEDDAGDGGDDTVIETTEDRDAGLVG